MHGKRVLYGENAAISLLRKPARLLTRTPSCYLHQAFYSTAALLSTILQHEVNLLPATSQRTDLDSCSTAPRAAPATQSDISAPLWRGAVLRLVATEMDMG